MGHLCVQNRIHCSSNFEGVKIKKRKYIYIYTYAHMYMYTSEKSPLY